MGNFGDAVSSLLDTYSRCLTLLGDFGRKKTSSTGNGNGRRTRTHDADPSQANLQETIRAARAQVLRTYSSKLQRRGDTFEKGDATSRGSLRRIVGKLTAALKSVMGSISRDRNQPVDYASLVSLSNASQIDALRTMSDLSHRIKSRSSASLPSSRSRSRHSSSASVSVTSSRKTRPSGRSRKRQGSGVEARAKSRDRHRPSANNHGGLDKRVSLITTSSRSTKIGELRRNDGRGGHTAPAYPLDMRRHESRSKPKKKKGSWWKLT